MPATMFLRPRLLYNERLLEMRYRMPDLEAAGLIEKFYLFFIISHGESRFASRAGQERLSKLLRLYFHKLTFNFLSNVLIYITLNLPSAMTNGTIRANIKEGMSVGIVLKQDQRTGKITQGVVKRILTNSSNHPHGIKVQLTNGQVGRVKEIYSEAK